MKRRDRNTYLVDIPFEEAWVRLLEALRKVGKLTPLPGERVGLSDVCGRVTAEPVWARISSPHYYAAAMDGYAVRADQTVGATETQPLTLRLGEEAYPVNTGDPLPPETNAVIMIEHVQDLENDRIEIRAPQAPWNHVRMMGEDIVATEMLLPANHKIRPVDVGSLAGCGHDSVQVRQLPTVIIIPTGSELVEAGREPGPGQIIEYNSLVLSAQIREAGGRPQVTEFVRDDPDQLRAELEQALSEDPDLVLVLSGASAGSKDYTAGLVRELGELLVHGMAVRPGHPVIIGMVKGIPVIGVPGYPVSAALTGELLIQPLLSEWSGIPATVSQRPRVNAVMTSKIMSPTGDDEYVRVTLAQVGEQVMATPLKRGAGIITSLVRADGLVKIPRFSEGLNLGQEAEVLLYCAPEAVRQRVLAMGSHDPMLDLLGQYLAERFPGFSLASADVGSMGGLAALRRGAAHLAGTHLFDEETGEYNISYLGKYLSDVAVRMITFAHREQGLIVAKGNPLEIQTIERIPEVRYVNRQRGAGTRVLFDYELKKRGIAPENITGYEHQEFSHLAVAAAVATGVADCGMGVRRAAVALDLDFVPLCWERYDFVIPSENLSHEGVGHLLAVLSSEEFQNTLREQPGYETDETGKMQYDSTGAGG
jgi:putative molybdopterin biosynthesis protein